MNTGASKARWDDSKSRRAHANECNVSTTPGEFILSFGVSRVSGADPHEFVIDLGQRIVMSPAVAKRLAVLLNRVLAEYESRFEGARPPAAPIGMEGKSRGAI